MRGKRLIAPLMALLLITAGIGGVGVPDRADPVQEGDALAPMVLAGAGAGSVAAAAVGAAIEAEFGILGGDGKNSDVSGPTTDKTNETVDLTTNVEAHQEHDDLRGHAKYQKNLLADKNKTMNNRVNYSKSIALGDAKAALLREYRDNESQSTAVAHAENETDEYYRALATNYIRGVATLQRGAVQANNAYCAHPDFQDGDGCDTDTSLAGLAMGASAGDTYWMNSPDTVYEVNASIYGQNRTFLVAGNKSASVAWVPGEFTSLNNGPASDRVISDVTCLNCSNVHGLDAFNYESSHNSESYSVWVSGTGSEDRIDGMMHQINSTRAEAFDEVDAMGASLYSKSPDISDINQAGFVGPSTLARRSLENATHPYAAASLSAGGINSTAHSLDPDSPTAQHLDIYLTESDKRLDEVTLYTDAEINFTVDTTYDPANYKSDIYAASMNGSGDVFVIDEKFTVRDITGSDGSDLNHVETDPAVDPAVLDSGGIDPDRYADAMANLSDRLDEIKAQQAAKAGGGGFLSGVGSGIGTPGLLGGGAALGVIILLIARPWGA
jgi:hypothetical protein